MGEGARRIALVRQLGRVEARAPAGEERVGTRDPGERGEGVVRAVEGARGPAEAEAGEVCGGGAVAGCETRIERPGLLGGIGGPRQEPAGLLQGEAEGDRLTLRPQPEETPGGGRSPEGPGDRARVEPATIEGDRIEGRARTYRGEGRAFLG